MTPGGNALTSYRTLARSFLSVAVLLTVATGVSAAEEKGISGSGASSSVSVDGYLSTKYVFRSASFANSRFRDQDLFGEMRVDLTAPLTNQYEFHFLGAGRGDLDDERDVKGFHPFEDIGDSRNSSFAGYLYEAHFDLNDPVARVSQIRIGRQAGTRDEAVFFDGIAIDAVPVRKVTMTLYGGTAVHFFELGARQGADTLVGAGFDWYPVSSTGVSLDYLSVTDERTFFQSDTNRRDELISFKLWQRISSAMKAQAKGRFINGESRDLNVRASGTFPGPAVEASVNYMRQFNTQNELTNEFSPLFDVLGQSRPYQSIDLRVRKIIGSRYAVGAGYFQRALVDSGQQSVFNREFSRRYGDVGIDDFFFTNLSLTVTGEQWRSDERTFNSSGADASFRFGRNKKGRLSAGSYYSMYKYDYYIQLGERTRVRTVYGAVKIPAGEHVVLTGGYEYESSIERYRTMKAGLRYDF